MIFATVAFTQVGNAFGLRAEGYSPLSFKSNFLFFWLTNITLALQLLAIYFPPLERIFGLTALAWQDLAIAFSMGIVTFAAVRLERWILRRKGKPVYSV